MEIILYILEARSRGVEHVLYFLLKKLEGITFASAATTETTTMTSCNEWRRGVRGQKRGSCDRSGITLACVVRFSTCDQGQWVSIGRLTKCQQCAYAVICMREFPITLTFRLGSPHPGGEHHLRCHHGDRLTLQDNPTPVSQPPSETR